MTLATTLSGIALAVAIGAVVILRAIAPKTTTTKDDEVLSFLEKVLRYFGKDPPAAT